MGTPTHGPASACSEMSIAALVLAAHARTGLVRAMRGEGGLALAGMAKKASGGRLSSSVCGVWASGAPGRRDRAARRRARGRATSIVVLVGTHWWARDRCNKRILQLSQSTIQI